MKQMSIAGHIKELRQRILISLVGFIFGTIFGYVWYSHSVPPIPALGDLLLGPYCALPPELRADFTGTGECRLLATHPFEIFMLRLKIAALAGVLIASPIWLAQIWRFVAPGLYKKEKAFSAVFLSAAVLLFVAGAVTAYVTISVGLEFLLGLGDDFQVAALSGDQYFSLLKDFMIIFGVCFEVPLFVIGLNLVGILQYEAIRDKRSIIYFLVCVFGALLSPGGEVVSMIVLSLSVGILLELSFQFCRINDKRRNRQRPDWLDLDDEQSSGPINSSGSIGSSGPIQSPAAVSATDEATITASAAPAGTPASAIGAPAPVAPGARPTRNSRPPRPAPESPTPTSDFRSRPVTDFDDVL